jgi:mannose-6-phosphate isomerase
MFVGLTNTPRDYAWGSTSAIADLLGRTRSGKPEAEYWLGTHHGSPSLVVDGPKGETLADITTLPFIMKVLAAATPVSLQAHPSPAQAREGFARENALGIPLDAPNRNYKDAHHKPELVYAVSDEFEALCGFRPVAATRAIVARLGSDPHIEGFLARLVDDASLPAVFEWLISRGPGVPELLDRVVELAAGRPGVEFTTVGTLAHDYPGDSGILISLLLNRVTLKKGEVVYLPAGNIHSYLRGLGIEVLAASDNVLRGGLTPKYVDVSELLHVLDFRPLPVPFLTPELPSPGVSVFRPDVPDFELVVLEPGALEPGDAEAVYAPPGASIALCTVADVRVRGRSGEILLKRGESVFVDAEEGELRFSGSGVVFLSTVNSEFSPPALAR